MKLDSLFSMLAVPASTFLPSDQSKPVKSWRLRGYFTEKPSFWGACASTLPETG